MNIIKYKHNREYKIEDEVRNEVRNEVGDNDAMKFEVYECTVGGMQQTTPGAIEKFEYPRHESAKHLILQHNKSWYNKYYTHQGVALHDTADVITNTMQRV